MLMINRKKIVVFGAGGFIGSHLVSFFKKRENVYIVGVDVKYPEYSKSKADKFIIADLRDQRIVTEICNSGFDEAYQLAANMGGARGQASEIEITAKQILKIKESMNKILSKHTGQPLAKIAKDTDRDFYLTAEEAKEYGVVDEVIVSKK
jgi:nucleoside-diphosphate-sugar epimerase